MKWTNLWCLLGLHHWELDCPNLEREIDYYHHYKMLPTIHAFCLDCGYREIIHELVLGQD